MPAAPVPSTSNSRRYVDRVIVPRRRALKDSIRFGSGVDFGADGISLVETRANDQIAKTLVWFAGFRTAACGIRGFGHVYVPASLRIVWSGGFESITLHREGRLSTALLRTHAHAIDRHFGPGTTDQIDIRRTLVIADG